MDISSLLRVVALLSGLVIIGEAFALLVGMHVLSERGNSWISFKNDLLLAADIVTGAGLMYFAAVSGYIGQSNLAYFAVALALLAHGYREWEYLLNAPHKFCVNTPLFVLNNVKLAGLVVITGLALVRFHI